MEVSGFSLPRPGRRFAILIVTALAFALVALLAAGWYFSSLMHSGLLKPDYSPDKLNLRVVSLQGNRIVLAERLGENVDSLDDSEFWGLEGESGYGRVGAVLGVSGAEVT